MLVDAEPTQLDGMVKPEGIPDGEDVDALF